MILYTRKLFIAVFIVFIILISILVLRNKNSFDDNLYDVDRMYDHMAELASSKYEGNLAGSKGNEKVIEYIVKQFEAMGLETIDGRYVQPFSTIVPQYDISPVFTIQDTSNITNEFVMYEDYNALSSMNGGPIDFNGALLLVGSNLFRIDEQLIKGKIIVIESGQLTQKKINYVLDNGGLGLLCCADQEVYGGRVNFEKEKSLEVYGKTGKSLLVGYISREMNQFLLNNLDSEIDGKQGNAYGTVSNNDIHIQITYPIVEVNNVIGIVNGRSENGKTLIISANIDGKGQGTGSKYFESAASSLSGMAILLELAKIVSDQERLPYESIVFIGFNGQEEGLAGSNYYVDHPLFPLEQTKVIHLNSLGISTIEGVKLFSDKVIGNIFADNIHQYAVDAGQLVSVASRVDGLAASFVNKKVPAVTLSDGYIQSTYSDTVGTLDVKALDNVTKSVMSYLKRVVYKDTGTDYLYPSEIIIIILLLTILALNIMLNYMYKHYPIKKVFNIPFEDIYLSLFGVILRKITRVAFPLIIALFALSILANINPETNIKIIQNRRESNISVYLTLKNSVTYLRSLFDFKFHQSINVGNIYDVIYTSSVKSLSLLSCSLTVAVIAGILRGMYEGSNRKNASLKSLGSIVVYSIPDVLIVLLGLILYTFIAKNFPQYKDIVPLKDFIFPVLTLSIIPTIYISRITLITIEEELKKDYIKNAKAIGLSPFKVYIFELLPVILFKILDTMPTIMAMLLSNMIIVEYLFNYVGIVYYLQYFYKINDVYRFVPLAMTLGLIYITFVYSTKWLSRFINPLKRKVE